MIKVYIGTAEAAAILGLTAQRVCQLHWDDPSFPEPLVRIGRTRGWDREQIVRYAKVRNPRVGRPAKARR